MKKLLIVLGLVAVLALGLNGCSGGGGGGGGTYSVVGLWQMTQTNSPGAVIGAIVGFRSNGTGYIRIGNIYGTLVWSQSGNWLVITVKGEGTAGMSLEWNGPDEFTWTNSLGYESTYVRIAYEAKEKTTGAAPEMSNASLAEAIGLR